MSGHPRDDARELARIHRSYGHAAIADALIASLAREEAERDRAERLDTYAVKLQTDCAEATALVFALEERIVKMQAALLEVEWVCDGDAIDRCPSCGAAESQGHDASCSLDAAIVKGSRA